MTDNFSFQKVELFENRKVMYILRGLPGSGKSTIATSLCQIYQDNAVICCADDFRITKDGDYVWKKSEVKDAHMKCEEKAREECRNGRHIVIIDKTNLTLREVRPYLDLACKYSYVPIILVPTTPWSGNIQELEKRNKHRVSCSTLQEMKDKFEDIIPDCYGWFLFEEESNILRKTVKGILLECCIESCFSNALGNSIKYQHKTSIGSMKPDSIGSKSTASCVGCKEKTGNLSNTFIDALGSTPDRTIAHLQEEYDELTVGKFSLYPRLLCTSTRFHIEDICNASYKNSLSVSNLGHVSNIKAVGCLVTDTMLIVLIHLTHEQLEKLRGAKFGSRNPDVCLKCSRKINNHCQADNSSLDFSGTHGESATRGSLTLNADQRMSCDYQIKQQKGGKDSNLCICDSKGVPIKSSTCKSHDTTALYECESLVGILGHILLGHTVEGFSEVNFHDLNLPSVENVLEAQYSVRGHNIQVYDASKWVVYFSQPIVLPAVLSANYHKCKLLKGSIIVNTL